jgi:hypothetical protein
LAENNSLRNEDGGGHSDLQLIAVSDVGVQFEGFQTLDKYNKDMEGINYVSGIDDGGLKVYAALFQVPEENFPFTATFKIESETGEVYNSLAITIKKEEDKYVGTFGTGVTVGSSKYQQQYDVDKTETKPVVFANDSPFLCKSPDERILSGSVWFGQKFSICFEVGNEYKFEKFSNVECGTNELFDDSGVITETYTTFEGVGSTSFSFTSVVFQTYVDVAANTFQCQGTARFTTSRRDLQGVPSNAEENATFSTFALSIKVGAIDTIAAGSISSIHHTALLVMAVMWGVLLVS